MKRKLIVVIALEISDWSIEERKEEARQQCCKHSEIPRLREAGASDLADLVVGAVENAADMFGGSEIYAKVKSVKPLAYGFEK